MMVLHSPSISLNFYLSQATCAFMNGLVFSSYKFFMRAQLDDPASVPSLTQVGLAGTGCGIVTS